MAKRYKYNCRECIPRVRNMCIEEAHISPGAKRIIERAFESHTDTEATWDLLQASCLLVQRDEMVIGEPAGGPRSTLLSRMRKREQESQPLAEEPAKGEKPPAASEPAQRTRQRPPDRSPDRPSSAKPGSPPSQTPPTIAPPSTDGLGRSIRARLGRLGLGDTGKHMNPASSGTPAPPESPPLQDLIRRGYPEPPAASTVEIPVRETPPVSGSPLQYPPTSRPDSSLVSVPGPKVLVARESGHRILLPEDGELILGRFDPLTRVKPDIDLTFEDRYVHAVSRRHASINGWQGRYEITDLGSRNGTWINGQRLALHSAPILHVGDEVRLGNISFFFDEVPDLFKRPPPVARYFLYCTFTGKFFPLPDKPVILIGRLDPGLGYRPDIDLSDEGEAASVVSRRHAQLIRSDQQLLVEDLGSAYKTRIDGRPVYVGTQVPIRPGQHLWLGGCVLALDIVAT
jgi:pSer/pThr/pTyr-binding forkhead associated (FHA) protein